MIKIFFDLDGTLIDYSKRNYFVYGKAIKDLKGKKMPFRKYWLMKRSRCEIAKVLTMSGVNEKFVDDFKKIFSRNIESKSALSLDRQFFFTKKVLKRLNKEGFLLYLISYRNSFSAAKKEVNNLGLAKYFLNLLIGKNSISGAKSKIDYIKKEICDNDRVYVVGDTEDDILSGKIIKACTIAVLSGIRNKEELIKNNPDYILRDIRGVFDLVK